MQTPTVYKDATKSIVGLITAAHGATAMTKCK